MTENVKPTLTIFTPTWNRAALLPRLFQSIASQVAADGSVEWLVIDDGSTDDTQEVLAGLARERPDLVRFLRVENGGKHRAINLAAHESDGDWVMIVDSDDAVAENGIADVLRHIQIHGDASDIGLIRALASFPDLDCQVGEFVISSNPCFHWEWKSRQRPFDSAQVFRREALLLHSFPVFPDERFMAESWLYHSLDASHKVFFVNRVWTNCWYQPGGLSDSALRIRIQSLRGTVCVYHKILDSPGHWVGRARAAVNLWRYLFHMGRERALPKLSLAWLLAPAGWMMYVADLMKIRRWRASP